MKIVVLILLSIFLNASVSCNYINKKSIECYENGIKWQIFKSNSSFPFNVISGVNVNRYGLDCYEDSNINEIECIVNFNNKKWHIYTNQSSIISLDLINKVKRFLSNRTSTNFANIKKVLKGDIDGDSLNEKVYLQKFASDNYGDYYRLIVVDDDGKVLWRGPVIEDSDNSYVFGEWDFGVSMPELLVDIDGDNQAELLAPAQQSDVSPTYYRILKWNGKRFVAQRPAVMMLSSYNPNKFIWVNPFPNKMGYGTWISELHTKNSKYRALADVTKFTKNGDTIMGRALIRFDNNLITVINWIKDVNRKGKSYIARISRKDKFNSRGQRLYSIRDILRQDRANYYKGKGDFEDKGSGYFKTFRSRTKINYMKIVPVNVSYSSLKNMILYQNPLLKITPINNKLKIEVLY